MGLAANGYKNAALNLLIGKHLSLHTAWPGNSGANEAAGVARILLDTEWGTPSGSLASDESITFPNVPAGDYFYLGLWDASSGGSFYTALPLNDVAFGFKLGVCIDVATDRIVSPAHGLVTGDRVAFFTEKGQALPGGITEGSVYYVVNPTTDDFQVSLTNGGAAVNITAKGQGSFCKMVPISFTSPPTSNVTINAGQLQASLN
jgi:hypothetical protein